MTRVRTRPGLVLAGMLAAASAFAAGPPRWRTLPPTPTLPPAHRSGLLPLDGVRIWYAEYGSGPPVLLLHGGLANADYWGLLVPFLVAHGRRVIVMDSRGHGRSTRSAAPFGYDLLADDALALLDALHVRRADLVGWSDGGIVGLDLAMRHPNRLGRLFAFGADADPSGLRADFDRTPVFGGFIRRTRTEYRLLSPTPGQYDAFVAQIGHMWQSEPHWTAADLRRITVPTTIADGDHDEAIRLDHDRFMAASIAHARLVILPDSSHFAMLQAPAEFDAAVLRAING